MSLLVTPESLINVLGVVYVHRKTSDGGDIYFTRYGLPHTDILETENWYEREWFEEHRERLEGTSAVYRVPTRNVDGRSLDLVVKNCRVGEDIPVETRTLLEFMSAEFNSPWEEFALVMEMREGRYGPPDVRIRAQEPLAIYVPPERMQVWQSGRSQDKINRIKARHPGIELDILRQYKLVYGWIRGKNVVKVLREGGLAGEDLLRELRSLTDKSIGDLEKKGFGVADMKPEHIIVGEEDTRIAEEIVASGQPDARSRQAAYLHQLMDRGDYSVIDYELLLRTPSHDEEVATWRRHSYLDDQRDRFVATVMPPHLRPTEILGVPYVSGHAESTGGSLWVVGRNARLFDFFLPERWRRTPSWRLSQRNDVHYTFTKDHVHIVWKSSRVGERPPGDPSDPLVAKAIERGFNSPFEEFSIAQHLSTNGVPTVYVRAIYRTGTPKVEPSADLSRFVSHRDLRGPEDGPVLREDRNYITLRGYYNGPDWWVAQQQGALCRPYNLKQAVSTGIVKASECDSLFDATIQRLRNLGYDGALLQANDMILAVDPEGQVLEDAEGLPEVRISNLELVWKL